ncbi:MAG: hypothetical protein QOG59_1175, partial [Solirubrobacteraceae bacterium]|nr:hypothetical protein [Solirubrobacteraceae bacterium]
PFLVWNALAALAWTLVAGLGGYWVGPPIAHVLGLANTAIIVAILAIVGLALAQVVRGHRQHDS